jgi:ribosomal protein L21E
VTPFEATFGYDPRAPLWEGQQYPGDEIVERKDFAEYLAQVKHTQLAARQMAHHNNQQTRMEYADKYDRTNRVAYPMYVAGDKVWVRVMDKTQRTPNPKLAPQWERGTIIKRGVTGTSYLVERHDRKRKKTKMVNVQQIKPWKEEREVEEPPKSFPKRHRGPEEPQDSQQEPDEEGDSENGEDGEEEEVPDANQGQDEEEDETADQEAQEPNQEDQPEEQPQPEATSEGQDEESEPEGMTTRSATRAGGGKTRHIPSARSSRHGRSLAKPQPPAQRSTGRQGTNQGNLQTARGSTEQDLHGEVLDDEDELMTRRVLGDEDELMIRRGTVRSHGDDDEVEEGPTEEKRVFNRGERREHEDEWEEPTLKRQKKVLESRMRAEATKAKKIFRQAVQAVSVRKPTKSAEAKFAAMTDTQLITALLEGDLEVSGGMTQAPVHQQGAGRPAQHPEEMTGRRMPAGQLPASKQRRVGPPSADRHWRWGRQQGPSEEPDGTAGPGSSIQPREDRPAREPPEAGEPNAKPAKQGKFGRQLQKWWAKMGKNTDKKGKKAERAAQATKAAAKSVFRRRRE